MPPQLVKIRNTETGEIRLVDPSELDLPQEKPFSSRLGQMGQGFMQGVKDAPRAFVETMGGIIPTIQLASDVLSGNREKAAPALGGLVGGFGGAALGGTLGSGAGGLASLPFGPAAPAVAAYTVPAGAALGGYLGNVLGSVAGESIVRDEGMPSAEDVGYALGQGAVPTGGVKVAQLGLKGAFGGKKQGAYTLPERLEQRAIGAKVPQMRKSQRQLGLGEGGEIRLGEAIKRVGQTGIFKETAGDPNALRMALQQEISELESNRIAPEIQRLEEIRQAQGVKLKPQFDATEKIIQKYKGSGEASKVETEALNRLIAIEEELGSKADTMVGLNEARKALNQAVFNPNDPLYLPEIQNALRKDIRRAQLEYAKQLDPNTTLLDDLEASADRNQIVSKVLDPQIASQALEIPKPRDWWRTTGGFGVPILAGTMTGSPLAGIAALGADYMYNTPKGQLFLADVLRGKPITGLPRALGRGSVTMQILGNQRQQTEE